MEEAPICALGGAVFKLPMKLDGLLRRRGSIMPRGVAEEILLIKHDLEKIIAILQGHISRSDSEITSVMMNCWMKEVRELSYDIDDCVDQYEHAARPKSTSCKTNSLIKKLKKSLRMANEIRELNMHPKATAPKKIGVSSKSKIARRKFSFRKNNLLDGRLRHRLWMANKIREFSVRVLEALQRHEMCKLAGTMHAVTTTAAPTYDISSTCGAHSWTPANPVGIEASVKKLEEWLAKDGEQKLRVVAILGPGGIGKTTLANELYCKLGEQFECRAFVRASQKPDMRRLLSSMLSQVRLRQPPHTWKVYDLIAEIRKQLQDKRYLIVVDGVWATSTWEIINCVLPDGNSCSRVLITTEIEDVAHKCRGYDSKFIFTMKPLGDDDSRKIFFSTLFDSEQECPSELNELSINILRKCGGFPLAIVAIASLLASKMNKPEQWDYIHGSLGYSLRTITTLEGVKHVLNLSYTNLPHHLKACMLYLSIYEEDYIIWKDDLVKQWIAEGLICATERQDREEIAERFFDDLVSRRMIQPVHIDDNDKVLSCVVHHMVLNLISYEAMQENFVISIDHSQTATRLADKVRRLSLHFGNAEDARPPTNMRLSQVRSLAFFGVFKDMPCISGFQLLQILILQFCGDEDRVSFDVTKISGLFRLRYLQVTCNVTFELHNQMRSLQCLESLKIDARASAIPTDIIHLPHLLHLDIPAQTDLPNGIGHMTSLRALGRFDLSNTSVKNVQSLGDLTNLRDLQLACHTIQSDNLKKNMQCLGLILRKLIFLDSITLVPADRSSYVSDTTGMGISGDVLGSVFPPRFLQRIELLPHICIFSDLPLWIGHLDRLCILKIGLKKLTRNGVQLLGRLPALAVLSLYVQREPTERIVFDSEGFSVLKYLDLRCSVPLLKFEADSMPNLWKLELGFNARAATSSIPVGVERLSRLKKICANIGGVGAEETYYSRAVEALREIISMHPGRPNAIIQRVDGVFGDKGERGRRTQGEEVQDMTLRKQEEDEADDKISSRLQKEEQAGEVVPVPLSGKAEMQTTKMPGVLEEALPKLERLTSSSDGVGSGAGESSVIEAGGGTPQMVSRYETQKRRDWNTFAQYLRNHRPPLSLAQCSGAHVLEFLRYLDQFGKTKVHSAACPFFGHPNPPAPCPCPLRQAWGSLDALVSRLRTAFEENGGHPESNPFAARAVRLYLREVREAQARARGISYETKKRKRPQLADTSGTLPHPRPPLPARRPDS